jgi:hypothetical protein
VSRALVTAKTSFVYVIGQEHGPQKVGFSQFPDARVKGLKATKGGSLRVHARIAVMADIVREVEALAHWLLRDHALGGEMFDVSREDAARAIAEAAERHADGQRAPSTRADEGRVNVPAPEAWIERLDVWRVAQRPIASRAEAVRKLVSEALDAREKKRTK